MEMSSFRKKHADLLDENEASANCFVMRALIALLILMQVVTALYFMGLFNVPVNSIRFAELVSIPLLLINIILCWIYKGRKKWLKWLLIFSSVFASAFFDLVFTWKAPLFILFPIMISSHYFSKRLTRTVLIATLIIFAFTAAAGVPLGLIDANTAILQEAVIMSAGQTAFEQLTHSMVAMAPTIKSELISEYLPKALTVIAFTPVFSAIASRTKKLIVRSDKLAADNARISTELKLASSIQDNMIPKLNPTFPDCLEFDVMGSCLPAKEVGGDFYDGFYIDDTHFALFIADVSGKGIPAALYMMISKTMLKTVASNTLDPAKILQQVNALLCENNETQMFVTVWFGIIDTKTGLMTCCNAGHEHPALRRDGHHWTLYRDKHGMMLGASDMAHFANYEVQLHPGDSLFLYTDGLPEALNPQGERFGTQGMIDLLNDCTEKHLDAPVMMETINQTIDDFSGDAGQFDDLTMLALTWYGDSRKGEDSK